MKNNIIRCTVTSRKEHIVAIQENINNICNHTDATKNTNCDYDISLKMENFSKKAIDKSRNIVHTYSVVSGG